MDAASQINKAIALSPGAPLPLGDGSGHLLGGLVLAGRDFADGLLHDVAGLADELVLQPALAQCRRDRRPHRHANRRHQKGLPWSSESVLDLTRRIGRLLLPLRDIRHLRACGGGRVLHGFALYASKLERGLSDDKRRLLAQLQP